jgi:hypothetical protein
VRAALVLGALAREPANVLHAPRQPVALELQLLEVQQARSAEGFVGAPCGVDWDVRKRPRDDLRELELEAGHLRAQ